MVRDVQPESPAAKAGLRGGDIILRLDGRGFGVEADVDFPERIRSTGTGRAVVFTIEREGEEKQIPVMLGSWPHPITAAEATSLFDRRIRMLDSPPAR